jgi:hypothetical protein
MQRSTQNTQNIRKNIVKDFDKTQLIIESKKIVLTDRNLHVIKGQKAQVSVVTPRLNMDGPADIRITIPGNYREACRLFELLSSASQEGTIVQQAAVTF